MSPETVRLIIAGVTVLVNVVGFGFLILAAISLRRTAESLQETAEQLGGSAASFGQAIVTASGIEDPHGN